MSRRTTAVVAGAGALALGLAVPAGAATSTVKPSVVNREVVQAELHPDGSLDVARLFSQLSVVGRGTVSVADPVSSEGLRNLDGFGNPRVKDGKALYTIHVDGTATRRTVSDFTKALPVEVQVAYTLDGKPVRAKDLVGRSGDVSATYMVSNVTGTPTPVTWKDGKGVSHTESVDLVTPMVGQIRTTLPAAYTELESPSAAMAADGHGGTVMSYSMVLFEPLGEASQSFTWKGWVKNGQVPPVTIEVVPVSPTRKPELQTGVEGYRDGAAQAAQLTEGAGQIDSNLLKLQAGAGQLLDGLTRLAAGAAQLRDGLGKAAPGASKLAAGAKDAKDGTAKLRAGLGDLSDGAGALSGGLDQAATGSGALTGGLVAAGDGADALADGIAEILAGVKGLPAALQADPDFQQLLGALTSVKAAIGSSSDVTPTTLLGGLTLLGYGLRSPLGVDGCDQTAAPGTPTACGAADAVELVQEQLAGAVASGGSLDQLIAAATGAYALAGCTVPPAGTTPVAGVLPPTSLTSGTACALISSVAYGLGLPAGVVPSSPLGGLKAQTGLASSTLAAVFAGVDASVVPGIAQVKAALSNPACDVTDPTNPSNPCGIKEVQGLVAAGIGQLVDSISDQLADALSQASTGADQLSTGMQQLVAGGAQLDSGLGQLADGGSQLADGAGAAADGAAALDDGLGKLSSGAGQLSSGVDKAASGAGDLADGLNKAKGGDQKVVAGAGELRSKGTSKLVAGGNESAGAAGKKYATLVALADKVSDGALPYGAPDGATGSAAYQLTLAGATTASHDNAMRGVAAALLLAAACAVSWFLRRRLSVGTVAG
jgi:putative membrane protein